MTEKTAFFRENYQILENIAGKLRGQTAKDIDELVPLVEQATKAYTACKERLEAVKLALNEHIVREE
jgi:exodeoxyribonuclease VII small subunit